MAGSYGTSANMDRQAFAMQGQLALEQQKFSLFEQQRKKAQKLLDQLLSGGGTGGGISPGAGLNPGSGGSFDPLVSNYGAGERAALEQDFATAVNNVLGGLESRGLGGSSLVAPAMEAVTRGKNLAIGQLNDRVFDRQLGIQERGLDRQLSLLHSLLGSVFNM